MATFTYDKLSIWVGQMNRADAMACSAEFQRYMQSIQPDGDAISFEIDYLLIRYAPCKITFEGRPIGDGDKVVIDEQEITFALPMTRVALGALPVDIALGWAKEADRCNKWLESHVSNFTKALMTRLTNAAPLSVSAQ